MGKSDKCLVFNVNIARCIKAVIVFICIQTSFIVFVSNVISAELTNVMHLVAGDSMQEIATKGIYAGKKIIIDKRVASNGNITIPRDRQIKVVPGGCIVGQGSIIFNGTFEAGVYKIFFDDLNIRFGPNKDSKNAIVTVLPEWWGAKSDGETVSSKSIQNAINSLSSEGGLVQFQSGTYVVGLTESSHKTHSIYISKDNVVLIGNKTTFMPLKTETVGYIVEIGRNDTSYISTSNVTINSIDFVGFADGFGKPSYVPSGLAITSSPKASNGTYNVNNVSILNCSFKGFCAGVNAFSARNINMSNCKFMNNVFYKDLEGGGYGVNLASCADCLVEGNTFIAGNTDRHAIYVSIHVGKLNPISKNILIKNNIIDWTSGRIKIIYAAPIVARCSENIVIENNTVRGGYNGIYVNTVNCESSNIKIINNTIYDLLNLNTSEYSGIAILNSAPSNRFILHNVLVKNNNIMSVNDFIGGIYVRNADNISLIGNTITVSGMHSYGIKILGDMDGSIIGNTLHGHSASYAGVIQDGLTHRIKLENNSVGGFKSHFLVEGK